MKNYTTTIKVLGLALGVTFGMFARTKELPKIEHSRTLFHSEVTTVAPVSKNYGVIPATTPITTVPPSRVWLDLKSTTGAASQMVIAYLSQGTLGVDFGYDAARFSEPNVLGIYSLINGNPFTIQARPLFSNTDIVEIGFDAPLEGSYSISINHGDGVFLTGQQVYIKDSMNGTIADLTAGPYQFSTAAGIYNNRFVIGYSMETLDAQQPIDKTAFTVYKAGNGIGIDGGSATIFGVTVYDMMGRKLYNINSVNNTKHTVTELASMNQVVIVETNTSQGKFRKKIIY